MAAEIPNLVKRNGIYYFRCRIPSILTNGRAREVKISLKTGNLTSDLFDVIGHSIIQKFAVPTVCLTSFRRRIHSYTSYGHLHFQL